MLDSKHLSILIISDNQIDTNWSWADLAATGLGAVAPPAPEEPGPQLA